MYFLNRIGTVLNGSPTKQHRLTLYSATAGSCCSVTHFPSHVGSSQPATSENEEKENSKWWQKGGQKLPSKVPIFFVPCHFYLFKLITRNTMQSCRGRVPVLNTCVNVTLKCRKLSVPFFFFMLSDLFAHAAAHASLPPVPHRAHMFLGEGAHNGAMVWAAGGSPGSSGAEECSHKTLITLGSAWHREVSGDCDVITATAFFRCGGAPLYSPSLFSPPPPTPSRCLAHIALPVDSVSFNFFVFPPSPSLSSTIRCDVVSQ